MDDGTADAVVCALVQVSDNVATASDWITPVLGALHGVTASEAAWKPAPDERSIWEITNHVLAWTGWVVAFLDCRDTDVTDWPPVSTADPAAWDTTCRDLTEALAAFRTKIAAVPGDALLQPPTPDATATNRLMGISSILVHNAYHAGQITKLRERYQAR